MEEITYEAGRSALADQESLVAGIRQRTGTLLAAHALVASFLGAAAVRARGLQPFGWVALSALVLGLAAAAVLLAPWRLRFSVDARELYDDLYERAMGEAPADTLGWLAEAGYGYQALRDRNAPRVQRMSWLSGALGLLMLAQTLCWLAALVLAWEKWHRSRSHPTRSGLRPRRSASTRYVVAPGHARRPSRASANRKRSVIAPKARSSIDNRLMTAAPRLDESWLLGDVRVPNRVMLAPLAGIGNWFVRLQAKRYGAGMAVSEMVSSHAIHYGNEKTCVEMLRIDPREREPGPLGPGGPVSIQIFGEDPATMREAAAYVRAAGADVVDINMGCPVPKVQKTGAGAALLGDPERAVAVARATVEGAGPAPVTVKLRSGLRAGDTSGFELAHRLVAEAGVSAIAFHPRSASVHHKGTPDYELAARLVDSLDAPVILTGGLDDATSVRAAFARTGAAAVMLARGALGNPWLFAELLRGRSSEPTPEEVLSELRWTMERAVEHLGEQRATRYLRKFYPWYVARLPLSSREVKRLQETLQRAPTLDDVRSLLELCRAPAAVAA